VTAVATARHDLDDGGLVRRHLEGDPQAFGALVDRYQTHLLTFVNGIVGDRERAENLVLDVFTRIYRHLRWFDRRRGVPDVDLRDRVPPGRGGAARPAAPKELASLSSR